jgi:hypothetical protein
MREVFLRVLRNLDIADTRSCTRQKQGPFCVYCGLLFECVGHLFAARTNKGIDYVGHRAPRVVLNGRRFTRSVLARTASEMSGVDALNVCRLPEARYFADASRTRDK